MEILDDNHCFVCGELVSATVISRRRKIIEVQGQIEIGGEVYAEARAKLFDITGENQ